MTLPFTIDEFMAVFAAYNAAIWPFQIAAYGLALVVLTAIFVPRPWLVRLAFAALAVLWLVNGIGYHLMFFAAINPIAPAFAAFFVFQAVLLLASAVRPGDLRLSLGRDFRSITGLITLIYALAIYPVLGVWAGHGAMAGPMFGVAPCPTTIFSIGLLLLARGRWVIWLSIIPILWSLIGLAAAIQLGIPEDLAMPVAGAVLAVVMARALEWPCHERDMTMPASKARIWIAVFVAAAGIVAAIGWQFRTDISAARNRIATGSTVMQTPCGAIEYADAGTGTPLLAVHGSGGGYDQGMAFAAPLTARGIRVIAVSRFGYLRSPMPGDGSAEAQADAFVCLLDRLGIDTVAIMGGSAGAPSALAMAINHPDRVSSLILVAPLAYKPPTEANSAAPMARWVENTMMSILGSDFLFWSATHLFRNQVMATVLATPPALMDTVSGGEQARANAMLDNILPISARIAGLRADTAASKSLTPSRLDLVSAPTLIISARDDGYGTYASAKYTAAGIAGAHFMGFDTGGHVWLGHNDAVMNAIADLILAPEPAAER